jgi:rod shape-determining protein MreD
MGVAVLADLLPMPGTVMPSLLLPAFYHWTLERPEHLPPAVPFAAGCAADALGGMPLGATAAALLIVQALLRPRRRWLTRQTWPVVWAGFVVMATAAAVLRWGLVSLGLGRLVPGAPVSAELAATVLIYPVVAGLLAWIAPPCRPLADAAAGR